MNMTTGSESILRGKLTPFVVERRMRLFDLSMHRVWVLGYE